MERSFVNSLSFARSLDQADPLSSFRKKFIIPGHEGKPSIYFCGNSLGLQPASASSYIQSELTNWASYGVEGHFKSAIPWYEYKDHLSGSVARLLGCDEKEVVVMNSLTVNLHLLLVSFYRPDKKRKKIICEYDIFPSDLYALQSQIAFHGFDPGEDLITLKPAEGEYLLRTDAIIKAIDDAGDSLATVMLGAVNYYTGQLFDLAAIAHAAHSVGATCGFNLAHAAGNVPLKLHDSKIDYACFCSYKYLNAGPGSVSGIFIHENHLTDRSLPRLAGWWGNDPATRFQVPRTFIPVQAASAWALSNDAILSMAALRSSLDIFDEAGLDNLRGKSIALTAYLAFIVQEVNRLKADSEKKLEIITPANPQERGCQLSIIAHGKGRELFTGLSNAGVVCDWREPNVIRLAPVPLYNTFEEVFRFGEILLREF